MDARTVRNDAQKVVSRLTGFFFALTLLCPSPAIAWGFFAHRTTGEIALENIRPETRAAMDRLFRAEALLGTPDCQLGNLLDATVWPDCVRRDQDRWGHTAAWHYRTAPIDEPYDARSNCSGGNCVVVQVERNQRVLSDESLPANVRLKALAFMVHFAGDVHMPLHSGDHDDRGGNDRTAAYGIVPGLNLHWIWDGPLAERAITASRPSLVRRYSPEERGELAGGTPGDWGRESWEIARGFIYPTAFGCTDCSGELPKETAVTEKDIEAAIPIAQRRVTQAGLRIARLLDVAFAPGSLKAQPRD